MIQRRNENMPSGDRTGPEGWGPRSGRGLGYCSGYDSPGFTRGYGRGMGRGYGRGYGRGFGRGYGRGYWDYGRGGGPGPYRFRDPYYEREGDLAPPPRYPQDNGPGEEAATRGDPPAGEKAYLEDTLRSLEEEMERIKERLARLE